MPSLSNASYLIIARFVFLNITSISKVSKKYQDLTRTLQHHYHNVKFIDLSISTLGVLSSHSADFITVLEELYIEDRQLTCIQRKISTITIRLTY